jgi:hypothetical protein
VLPWLDEDQRRKFLASEAISLGRGGIQEISAISGVHRNTIAAGVKELNDPDATPLDSDTKKRRIRAKGAGRKPITETQPGIKEALGQHRTMLQKHGTAIHVSQNAVDNPLFGLPMAHRLRPPGRACQPESNSPART